MKGTVKWFNASKGFGFITSEGEDRDIFVHYSSIKMEGFKTLNEGDEVEFNLIMSERGPQAADVAKVVQ